PFRPVQTKVPGIQVCEYLPKMTEQIDKLAIIRSMRTQSPDHPDGIYHMHTCWDTAFHASNHERRGKMLAKAVGTTLQCRGSKTGRDRNPIGDRVRGLVQPESILSAPPQWTDPVPLACGAEHSG